MDIKTIRKHHAHSSFNRNTLIATMEGAVGSSAVDDLSNISNELADVEGSATPQELVRILRRNGCEQPFKFLYYSLFYTVSSLMTREYETKLE